MNSQQFSLFLVSLAVVLILPASHLSAAESQGEWESTLAAARKEGKVVVGIPPSAELRKQMEATFKSRFGIEAELFSAPGPQIASRIVSRIQSRRPLL
jgi:hypothetical protein